MLLFGICFITWFALKIHKKLAILIGRVQSAKLLWITARHGGRYAPGGGISMWAMMYAKNWTGG